MSYQSGRNRKNNPHAEVNKHKKIIEIGRYLELHQEYEQYPARIVNGGEMEVLLSGHYVGKSEFEELVSKPPFVEKFYTDATNIDSTRSWSYK